MSARPASIQRERTDARPQLRHRRGGFDRMARDIAEREDDPLVVQREYVVKVAAHFGVFGAGDITHGDVEPGNVRQFVWQQAVLQGERDVTLGIEGAHVAQRRTGCARVLHEDDVDFVIEFGVAGNGVRHFDEQNAAMAVGMVERRPAVRCATQGRDEPVEPFGRNARFRADYRAQLVDVLRRQRLRRGRGGLVRSFGDRRVADDDRRQCRTSNSAPAAAAIVATSPSSVVAALTASVASLSWRKRRASRIAVRCAAAPRSNAPTVATSSSRSTGSTR